MQPDDSPDGASGVRTHRYPARLGDGPHDGLVRSRGLASLVFALPGLAELGTPTAGHAVGLIAVAVLLSVVAHCATA